MDRRAWIALSISNKALHWSEIVHGSKKIIFTVENSNTLTHAFEKSRSKSLKNSLRDFFDFFSATILLFAVTFWLFSVTLCDFFCVFYDFWFLTFFETILLFTVTFCDFSQGVYEIFYSSKKYLNKVTTAHTTITATNKYFAERILFDYRPTIDSFIIITTNIL